MITDDFPLGSPRVAKGRGASYNATTPTWPVQGHRKA